MDMLQFHHNGIFFTRYVTYHMYLDVFTIT